MINKQRKTNSQNDPETRPWRLSICFWCQLKCGPISKWQCYVSCTIPCLWTLRVLNRCEFTKQMYPTIHFRAYSVLFPFRRISRFASRFFASYLNISSTFTDYCNGVEWTIISKIGSWDNMRSYLYKIANIFKYVEWLKIRWWSKFVLLFTY